LDSVIGKPRFVRLKASLARIRAHKLRTALTVGVIVLTALCMLLPLTLIVCITLSSLDLRGSPFDPGESLGYVYPELKTASWAWGSQGNGPLHVASPNPRLVYALRPNAKVAGVSITNSYGFRDYEFSEDKPPETFRIVVLGDSVTFGWWEKTAETYPKVLEALLNAEGGGRHFEVYNMSVGGYNSEQEAELLKTRAFAFHPDLIIVGFCPNDALHLDGGQWGHFYLNQHSKWACSAERFKSEFGMLWWLLTDRGLITRAYEEMQRNCAQKQVPLLVVSFPSEGLTILGRTAERVFRRMNLDVVSLRQDYDAAGWEKISHSDGFHPNVLGHAIAARRIFEHINTVYLKTAPSENSAH